MSVIELNPTTCRNCYKCIRECPIKAIAFKDGRAKIIDKECILCGICAKSCPADAIAVEKKERTWAIDPFRCVQCGTCVRVCPKHCLTMDPAYTPIATAKSCRVVHVPDPKAAVTES